MYYLGYGGNYNSTTRFRRYDGNEAAVTDEKVSQNAGNNIKIGMGFGLIFPVILLFMLFLLYRKKSTQPQISKH